MKKTYDFQTIEQIHKEAKGECLAFNEGYKERNFYLETVTMEDIPFNSLWKIDDLVVLSESNEWYRKDLDAIRCLIHAIEKGEKLPPVVLGVKQHGKYDIKDGVHRLSAMREVGIQEFEAFVMIPIG